MSKCGIVQSYMKLGENETCVGSFILMEDGSLRTAYDLQQSGDGLDGIMARDGREEVVLALHYAWKKLINTGGNTRAGTPLTPRYHVVNKDDLITTITAHWLTHD